MPFIFIFCCCYAWIVNNCKLIPKMYQTEENQRKIQPKLLYGISPYSLIYPCVNDPVNVFTIYTRTNQIFCRMISFDPKWYGIQDKHCFILVPQFLYIEKTFLLTQKYPHHPSLCKSKSQTEKRHMVLECTAIQLTKIQTEIFLSILSWQFSPRLTFFTS